MGAPSQGCCRPVPHPAHPQRPGPGQGDRGWAAEVLGQHLPRPGRGPPGGARVRTPSDMRSPPTSSRTVSTCAPSRRSLDTRSSTPPASTLAVRPRCSARPGAHWTDQGVDHVLTYLGRYVERVALSKTVIGRGSTWRASASTGHGVRYAAIGGPGSGLWSAGSTSRRWGLELRGRAEGGRRAFGSIGQGETLGGVAASFNTGQERTRWRGCRGRCRSAPGLPVT